MTPVEKADEVADYLIGTANSLQAGLGACEAEDMEDNKEFLSRLDERCFCCEGCGWWSAEDEHGEEDGHCDECSPRED